MAQCSIQSQIRRERGRSRESLWPIEVSYASCRQVGPQSEKEAVMSYSKYIEDHEDTLEQFQRHVPTQTAQICVPFYHTLSPVSKGLSFFHSLR